MRLYKTCFQLALLFLLFHQCHFKCKEFAPILIDVGLFDINTNTAISPTTRELIFRIGTEGPPTDLSVRKNLNNFTVTVPPELFASGKLYTGVILVDNQVQTNLWIQFDAEGRGCPNPARITTLDRSSRNATTAQAGNNWSISIRL